MRSGRKSAKSGETVSGRRR